MVRRSRRACPRERSSLGGSAAALALGAPARARTAARGLRGSGLIVRIAITADPYLPVPPRHYGGIERVIDLLVCGLTARGHDVTLFAHPESRTAATLRPYGVPPHIARAARLRELAQVGSGLWHVRRRVDVVHSFGRLAALLPVLPLRGLPKVQSYQRAVPWPGVRRAARMAGDSLVFTGCSTSLYAAQNGRTGGRWRTIFNGVNTSRYTPAFTVDADAPLVFLGRIERIKGPHHAITIARRAKRRLVIAGNVPVDGPAARFYDEEIAPHVDGQTVQYIGPVTDEQKNALLGQASALLMPIEWEEPFGIVMAEAFACATPVIAFARGSVAEVVQHGRTGFHCANVEEAVAAVGRLHEIDRAVVRSDCEQRFSHEAVVSAYERLYLEFA
jgi:glycosyltransferase involved in cell wall biosynthesis